MRPPVEGREALRPVERRARVGDATQRGAGMRHSEGQGCDTARGRDASQRGAGM
jgi:hypothetical protein